MILANRSERNEEIIAVYSTTIMIGGVKLFFNLDVFEIFRELIHALEEIFYIVKDVGA